MNKKKRYNNIDKYAFTMIDIVILLPIELTEDCSTILFDNGVAIQLVHCVCMFLSEMIIR